MTELNDTLKVTGMVTLRLFDAEGKLIHEQVNPNLVVSVGKSYLASWLAAASQPGEFMSYVGLGTGTTPPSSGDTNLQTPLPTRVQGVLSSSSNTWQNQATFPAGVDTNPAITEAGLFSAASGGTMFARNVFSAIPKGAGSSIIVVWQVQFN